MRANRVFAIALIFSISVSAHAQDTSSFWTTPRIAGIGQVHVWAGAILRPNPDSVYRAVFDLADGTTDGHGANQALERVARAVNVFAVAGVPSANLRFVVVIHGAATPIALRDSTFRVRFHRANPNLTVIRSLEEAGVTVTVCGNALADNSYGPSDVNPGITVSFSALSTLIILQNSGYALVRL